MRRDSDGYLHISLRAWTYANAVIGSLIGLGIGWVVWG